jgi:hypothetical protein
MTQYEKILNHIRRAGHITVRQALLDYSIQSLTRRIVDLEEMGFVFEREVKHHPVTMQRYTRYKFHPESPKSMDELRIMRRRQRNGNTGT